MSEEDNNRQARLPLKDVPVEIQEKFVQLGVNRTLNLHKMLANHPILLSSYVNFGYSLLNDCKTSRQTRELMILLGAQLCHSDYQWFQHEQMAKTCGISQQKIDAINQWKQSSLFDEEEKIAMELMENLVLNKGKINEQLDQKLKKQFNESEYIELVLTGSFYATLPILLEALQVPLEK